MVIAGSDLGSTTLVQFGSARATVAARTANSATVTSSPGSTLGSVPVTVRTPTGTSAISSAAIYTYAVSPIGYWLAASDGGIITSLDGGIITFGGAGLFGSTGDEHLNQPIMGMAN